jgi:hypothetical protein
MEAWKTEAGPNRRSQCFRYICDFGSDVTLTVVHPFPCLLQGFLGRAILPSSLPPIFIIANVPADGEIHELRVRQC